MWLRVVQEGGRDVRVSDEHGRDMPWLSVKDNDGAGKCFVGYQVPTDPSMLVSG